MLNYGQIKATVRRKRSPHYNPELARSLDLRHGDDWIELPASLGRHFNINWAKEVFQVFQTALNSSGRVGSPDESILKTGINGLFGPVRSFTREVMQVINANLSEAEPDLINYRMDIVAEIQGLRISASPTVVHVSQGWRFEAHRDGGFYITILYQLPFATRAPTMISLDPKEEIESRTYFSPTSLNALILTGNQRQRESRMQILDPTAAAYNAPRGYVRAPVHSSPRQPAGGSERLTLKVLARP